MPPLAEVLRYLWGAWRLVRRDERGLEVFGTRVDDFWRSFWAAAIVAPLYFGIALLRYGDGPAPARAHPFFY